MFGDFTPVGIVLLIVVILVSLTIHEMMHAWVGFKLGDDTAAEQGRISLNPLAHIDPIMTVALPILTLLVFQMPILAAKPVPFNPERVKWGDYGAALIAAAGPLSNLLIAVVAAVAYHQFGAGSGFGLIAELFVFINVSLFVFNLIPIPPLDGSRVLYAFAPDAVRDVFDTMEQYGFFIIFGLIILLSYANVNPVGQLTRPVLRFLL